MRFHTYTKYNGTLFDALNIESLLEQLADFLLQSGFAGGPQYHPWWGWTGEEGNDRSLDALKQALLQALIESGLVKSAAANRTDPLAPFRRMSQAEKVAFFT